MQVTPAVADPSFDRFARVAREALNVPVALVSIVDADRHVMPGAIGLPEPYRSSREVPINRSFCRFVVSDDRPLIVTDTRADDRLRGNASISELSALAYAGFPLHDARGNAVGALCAVDRQPHEWRADELDLLRDLAELCSQELAQRENRDALAQSARAANDLTMRARLLLSLSERLAETHTSAEIADALHDVAIRNLGCSRAGIWLLSDRDDHLHYVASTDRPWPHAEAYRTLPRVDDNPIGATLTRRRPLYYRDRAARDEPYPGRPSVTGGLPDEARAFVPLIVAGQELGTLALVWDAPRVFSGEDRISIAALASYTSQAVHRATLLAERTSAARTMQVALLTELPAIEGLELAARYRTAGSLDQVGGDWYDVVALPDGDTLVTIGDVAGHDLAAAAVMGSLRNMLRALAWAIQDPPSASIARLDRAAHDLAVDRMATLVLGRLAPPDADGSRHLTWSSAGHPPPILITPDGRAAQLPDERPVDCPIGVLPRSARHDNAVSVPSGSTLLFFTDGLVETRAEAIEQGIERLAEAASRLRGRPLPELLDAVLDELIGRTPCDDVAVLALHVHPVRPRLVDCRQAM